MALERKISSNVDLDNPPPSPPAQKQVKMLDNLALTDNRTI